MIKGVVGQLERSDRAMVRQSGLRSTDERWNEDKLASCSSEAAETEGGYGRERTRIIAMGSDESLCGCILEPTHRAVHRACSVVRL